MATQEINVRLPSMYGKFYFTVKNSELIGDNTLSGVFNISNMIGKTIGLLTISFETDGSTITNIHTEDCSIVPIEINSNDYDINFTFTINLDNSPVNFVITNLPVTYYDDLVSFLGFIMMYSALTTPWMHIFISLVSTLVVYGKISMQQVNGNNITIYESDGGTNSGITAMLMYSHEGSPTVDLCGLYDIENVEITNGTINYSYSWILHDEYGDFPYPNFKVFLKSATPFSDIFMIDNTNEWDYVYGESPSLTPIIISSARYIINSNNTGLDIEIDYNNPNSEAQTVNFYYNNSEIMGGIAQPGKNTITIPASKNIFTEIYVLINNDTSTKSNVVNIYPRCLWNYNNQQGTVIKYKKGNEIKYISSIIKKEKDNE